MSKLLCCGYSVTSSEVPGEISLCFEISGCPHRCPGCHSSYLQEYQGKSLAKEMRKALSEYADYITCVCFMGGDQDHFKLHDLVYAVKQRYPHLKVCVYSGNNELPKWLTDDLDYYKTGEYIAELGGLDSPTTNQRMYRIRHERLFDKAEDITEKFRKKT